MLERESDKRAVQDYEFVSGKPYDAVKWMGIIVCCAVLCLAAQSRATLQLHGL